jgi:hypothetical protein
MQHIVDTDARRPAVVKVADISLDEAKARPLFRGYQTLHLIQIVLMAGSEVVQANDVLIQLQQGFKQVAANKTGDPGPASGGDRGAVAFATVGN